MPASLHFKELLQKLNEYQVRYLVVGAYAVMNYTEPRYTKDLDVWVEPTSANAERVFRALTDFGAPTSEVTVEDLTNSDLIFQIGVAPHRIDIIMAVKGLNFAEAWARRVETKFEDQTMALVCKSDLMVSKQAAGRPQDLLDLEQLRKSDQLKS
jgi:hypothetical protein